MPKRALKKYKSPEPLPPASDSMHYWTLKQAVEAARSRGIPITVSRVHKDRLQNRGPDPAARYGAKLLYKPADFMAWALGRITPVSEGTADAA